MVAMVALSIAIFSGLIAAGFVFKFMARIVKVSDAQMLDWDYRIEGTVGTISSPVREEGKGEMIFEQRGVRKSVGVRSVDGKPLPNGAEGGITRYESELHNWSKGRDVAR